MELPGFESPFTTHLAPENRWVKLARQIPWDRIYTIYQRQLLNRVTGANGINPRVAIGAIMIKHICNLSDRETILQIQENVYMQYFIGFSSFSKDPVFDPSLFVELRKRFGTDQINEITETILKLVSQQHAEGLPQKDSPNNKPDEPQTPENATPGTGTNERGEEQPAESPIVDDQVNAAEELPPSNKGSMLVDATACPQDIAYPTDLNLINDARTKSEELIDVLYELWKEQDNSTTKPRTYREIARKEYLKVAQKKHKTRKEIRHAIRKQLCYLRRNIRYIHQLLSRCRRIPLNWREYKYLLVIQTLYDQQKWMYDNRVHSIEHRIVSIHQPHVRPIVRGKTNAYVEFGAKIQMSIMNGLVFLEDLSWDAFNEGTRLIKTVSAYKRRFGYYPEKVFADKIYCTRENRTRLKALNIKLMAKPLGRPTAAAVDHHVRPGERNPIEGKFGQAKTAYGMNRIKARLSQTSESWIASIVLVLNLIKIIGKAPLCLLQSAIRHQFLYVFFAALRPCPAPTRKNWG
jgi:transposase, IS5 family